MVGAGPVGLMVASEIQRAGPRSVGSTRFNGIALVATMIELADISAAGGDSAGGRGT